MLDPAAWRDVPQEVSTGSLPGWDRVEESVRDAAKAQAAEAHCDSVFTPGELMLASFKAFFFDSLSLQS